MADEKSKIEAAAKLPAEGAEAGGDTAAEVGPKVVPISKEGTSKTAAPSTPKIVRASIYGSATEIPTELHAAIKKLEAALQLPVWVILQNAPHTHHALGHAPEPFSALDESVYNGFFEARQELEKCGPIALLIDSPGGYAREVYKLAKLIRNHAGGFVAVVPSYAKSAATLLSLGADQILLGQDAELGPLDAQILDPEREDSCSALDEVQALERLNAAALGAIDETILLLKIRSGKKLETLLPIATRFVADMMRPLLEKIDTVHYSQMQRMLKEAEDYAIRLLQPRYSEGKAKTIARHLVEKYPEHGFVIDAQEAAQIGLETLVPTPEQSAIFDEILPQIEGITLIGRLQEIESDEQGP